MMSLKSFEQICWVVGNLEESIMKWVSLGAGPFYVREVHLFPEREYRGTQAKDHNVMCQGFFGNTQIELTQPINNEPSIFREIFDAKGESLHHIQPRCRPLDTAGFEADCRRYEEAGLKQCMSLTLPDSSRVVFYDAVATQGFFIELVERPMKTYNENMLMYQEHLTWDGKDPIRKFENRPQ